MSRTFHNRIVRRFAVAIAHGDSGTCNPKFVWEWAQKYADAEPNDA